MTTKSSNVKMFFNSSIGSSILRAGVILLLIGLIFYGLIPQCNQFYLQKKELQQKNQEYSILMDSVKNIPQMEEELQKNSSKIYNREIQSNEDETVCVTVAALEKVAKQNSINLTSVTPGKTIKGSEYYDLKNFSIVFEGTEKSFKKFIEDLRGEVPSLTVRSVTFNSLKENNNNLEMKLELAVNFINNHQSISDQKTKS